MSFAHGLRPEFRFPNTANGQFSSVFRHDFSYFVNIVPIKNCRNHQSFYKNSSAKFDRWFAAYSVYGRISVRFRCF